MHESDHGTGGHPPERVGRSLTIAVRIGMQHALEKWKLLERVFRHTGGSRLTQSRLKRRLRARLPAPPTIFSYSRLGNPGDVREVAEDGSAGRGDQAG